MRVAIVSQQLAFAAFRPRDLRLIVIVGIDRAVSNNAHSDWNALWRRLITKTSVSNHVWRHPGASNNLKALALLLGLAAKYQAAEPSSSRRRWAGRVCRTSS
jgi:hypothetical protein